MSADTQNGCDDCEKVALEKRLAAEESVKAFEREKEKLALEHQNSLDTAEETAATELQKSRWESEFSLAKLFHEKVTEVAAGSVERSRDSAKYIQTAAAWIATLYSGLLALVFSVTDYPLPLRGVFAAIFLGLAVALAAAYLAFITTPRKIKLFDGGASLTEQQINRTGFLIKWVNATVRDRRWAIRASVLCLAFGVAFIPAAFVSSHRPAKVPDAPAAPAIPSQIDPSISDSASKLFASQIGSYESAVKAHNEAIEESATDAQDVASEEGAINRWTLGLAVLCFLIAMLGPLAWSRIVDEPGE